MDISGIFNEDSRKKEASLADLRWLEEDFGQGLSREDEFTWNPAENGADKDNNIKPEAEIEWGYGSIDEVYSDHPESGIVDRNIPVPLSGENGPVVIFARNLMNRGQMGTQLVRNIKAKFPQASIDVAQKGLTSLMRWEGLVGTVVLDARGYDNCQEAMKVSQHSPYKRYLKYVLGCSCGSAHMIADESGHDIVVSGEVGDNSVDNFFTSSAADSAQPQKTAHCPLTMMPLLARGDLDPSEQDPTMISPIDDVKIPEHLTKGLWNDNDEQTGDVPIKGAGLIEAQRFFRNMSRKAEQESTKQYKASVTSEWSMDMAENEVDVMPAPQASFEDVLLVDPSSQQDIDLSAPMASPIDDELAMGEMPVEIMPEQRIFTPTAQDIEIGPSELVPEIGESDDFAIDMEPELDDTFEGTDVIDLDDASTPEDIDIDMSENDITFF